MTTRAEDQPVSPVSPVSPDCPGHCGCGQPFDHYTDWAQHAQTAGCRHWRLDRPIPRENPAA